MNYLYGWETFHNEKVVRLSDVESLEARLSAAESRASAAEREAERVRKALRAVGAHHSAMNRAVNRPEINSTTLRIVASGLAGCDHLPGDVCHRCQPTIPVCAVHPTAPTRRFGHQFRCSECGEPGSLLMCAALAGSAHEREGE